MSKNKAIIVKKVKKGGGGGHHGGAWKVAYADFVTAMMAFFLLMWLLNMTSDEKRARLSAYFKYFSIYESGGTSWMDKSSEIFSESGETTQKVFADKKQEAVDNSMMEASLGSIEETLKNDIAEKLSDMKDQVLVDVVDEGIRIQMTDKEGSLMFERGSTVMTPKARKVLELISADVKNLSNKIIIEGHTDSLQYAGSQYSNWELSTERASSARKELEAAGLDPKRISRVAGYADTDPLIKDNKQDPRNRRISITLSAPTKAISKMSSIRYVNTAITSDEKQLRQASDELRHLIDNKQAPVNDNAGSSQDIIKMQKSPVIKSPPSNPGDISNRPPPVIKSESKGPSVIKELSEPIIKLP